MDYFAQLERLLKTEKEEDKRACQALLSTTTAAERRAAGLSWYPVAIRGTEPARGDYLTVELERTTHQDIPHQLRFGAAASLFSNHDPKERHIDGVVAWQGGNRLKLTLRTEELPDWADEGKLGIDLLFDDNSYDEMEKALKSAATLQDKPDGRLVRVLTGVSEPAFDVMHAPPSIPSLNASQQQAVGRILAAQDLAIVHGPPGTGKTTTLVQAIKALIQRGEKQVLVTAPSNTAVDLLTEKLSDQGLNVVRVGNPVRVSERLSALTLDGRIASHPQVKDIKRLKKQAAEFRDMAHTYKRNFGKAEREQRKALFDEARNIMKSVEQTEQYICDDVLDRAQVITATLVGANHYTVRRRSYDTVVIDEAGQALEPACWIPMLKAKKVVLAGDHCQLSPTVKSAEAARDGLSVTLLEKMAERWPGAVTMLDEQYRMHAAIMGYSSGFFYRDALKAHASVAGHLLHAGDAPLAFVDTAGCGFDEKTEGGGTANPEEAAFLFRHLTALVEALQTHYRREDFPSIAVISPYRLQIELLKEQLRHTPALQGLLDKITINTIDSFQGQERDIVYISMTRSNADSKIGFLADARRMNVAMTRARKKLVIIGDSATLSREPFYADFITYAEQRDAYRSAWEYMDA
ncbi:AAA domain-containing protein [Chitinophaga lutea]